MCLLLVVKLFIIIFAAFQKSNYTNRSAHLRIHIHTHTLTHACMQRNAHTYHWQNQLNSNVWLGSWQLGKGCVHVASVYFLSCLLLQLLLLLYSHMYSLVQGLSNTRFIIYADTYEWNARKKCNDHKVKCKQLQIGGGKEEQK